MNTNNSSLQKSNNYKPLSQSKMKDSRRRSQNWSAYEKKYLLQLIKERRAFVVNKNNNGPCYDEEKETAWREILQSMCQKFGSRFEGSTTRKVKTQWQNMKRCARKEIDSKGAACRNYSDQTIEVSHIMELEEMVNKPISTNSTSTPMLDSVIKQISKHSTSTSAMGLFNKEISGQSTSTPSMEMIDKEIARHSTSTPPMGYLNEVSGQLSTTPVMSLANNEISRQLTSTPIIEMVNKEITRHSTGTPMIEIVNKETARHSTSSPMITADVVVKTERIEEDDCQPNCSTSAEHIRPEASRHPVYIFWERTDNESSSTSISDQQRETEDPSEDNISLQSKQDKSNPSAMNDISAMGGIENIVPVWKTYKDYKKHKECCNYSSVEKQMKITSLKEEIQLLKTMNEAAMLNKLAARHKLMHLVWKRKQDMAYVGELGSGAGKGGGGGGAIREAGGAFGKQEAAREEEYFYKKQKEQMANLKNHLDKEIAFHRDQIKRHEDAIKRHQDKKTEIE